MIYTTNENFNYMHIVFVCIYNISCFRVSFMVGGDGKQKIIQNTKSTKNCLTVSYSLELYPSKPFIMIHK